MKLSNHLPSPEAPLSHGLRSFSAGRILFAHFILAALCLACSTPALAAGSSALEKTAGADSLVRNGGFESEGLSPWSFVANREARAAGLLDTAEKHAGQASVKIVNRSEYAPNVFGKLGQRIGNLKPNTTYQASAWFKGQSVRRAWFGGGPGWKLRTPVPSGSFDWMRVTFLFTIGPRQTDFEIVVVSEAQTDALWIDDVALIEISAPANP